MHICLTYASKLTRTQWNVFYQYVVLFYFVYIFYLTDTEDTNIMKSQAVTHDQKELTSEKHVENCKSSCKPCNL